MSVSHPYLQGADFICFAHRGGALENPENSRRAFAAAVGLGYRYIETDVQATADGAVVVFHDDALDRVTDTAGVIAELPFAEVRAARIDGTEPIMTLEEALESFPDTRFNIEVKIEAALVPTLEIVQRMACLDRICLASSSGARVARMRRMAGPGLCTNAPTREAAMLVFAGWGLPTPPPRAQCAQVPVVQWGVRVVTPRFIRSCNRRGVQVHVWTIDDEAQMRRLIRMGVNGLMTDRPRLLRKVAMEEGVW